MLKILSIFSFINKTRKPKTDLKPVILLSLDGWGDAVPSDGNAIAKANVPNMRSYPTLYPHGLLIASGESVGLPANEVGNSEVGHLTMGTGRVILQSLEKINKSIEDGSFLSNQAFLEAIAHTRQHSSRLHIMGLVGSGNVHSSTKHFEALLEVCKKSEMSNVVCHLFTDGRDSPPQEGVTILEQIETQLRTNKVGRVATIAGRYYGMDRDGRWERTQASYEAIVAGKGPQFKSVVEAIKASYVQKPSDEFVVPSVIVDDQGQPTTVNDNDAVIFFNFRIDRPRQLALAFTLPDFEKLKGFQWGFEMDQGNTKTDKKTGPTFKRSKWPQNLFFVTMTEYQKNIPVQAIAYPISQVDQVLPQVIADRGLHQMHLAESEKERMVTYYFDGLRDQPFMGEEKLIVPSPRVATYDKRPQMAVFDVVKAFKRKLYEEKYDFFMINFANADMVAHTGNLQSTIKACEFVDKAVGELVEEALRFNATVFITADHGNAEELLTYPTGTYFFTTDKGSRNTDHSNNPIPFYIIGNQLKGNPKELPQGALEDVAPTILAYMNLPKPPVMTGRNLLE
jgi:2,3-bisphosphoglycerate-independent phosphoglycerate mutase